MKFNINGYFYFWSKLLLDSLLYIFFISSLGGEMIITKGHEEMKIIRLTWNVNEGHMQPNVWMSHQWVKFPFHHSTFPAKQDWPFMYN